MIFADKDRALAISRTLYPEAGEYTLVEHGYDNLVVLVDSDYAIRFPRNENAYLRSKYEQRVLEALEGIGTVSIPHVITAHENPVYLITSFVLGRHLTINDIRSFSIDLQNEFANKVTEFAYAMHTSLSIKEARMFRKELTLDELEEEPWDIYFEKTLIKATFPTKIQDDIAKEYYRKWSNIQVHAELVVVHDDLHAQNMLFNENRQLTGVLDFGDTNVGTPEQELRQLYWYNENILSTALAKYQQLSHRELNIEAAKIWSVMQELASYSNHVRDSKTQHASFKRACSNLDRWFSEGLWSLDYK